MTDSVRPDPRDCDGYLDGPPPGSAGEAAPSGRREAHKRATRAAIRAAADELIAAQGFEATTVRQIADAAGVTERTFYRYFDGKEGLVAAEMTAWMDSLYAAIVARPERERPVEAVRAALGTLVEEVGEGPRREILWAFTDHPAALRSMRRSGTRPLLRLEGLITRALLERDVDATGRQPDRFECELIARTVVAALRTIAAERRRSPRARPAEPPAASIGRTLDAVGALFTAGG